MTAIPRANLSVAVALATGFGFATACDPGSTRDESEDVRLNDESNDDDDGEFVVPESPDETERDRPTGSTEISMAPDAMALCRSSSGGDWCSAHGAGELCSNGCCGVLTGGQICNDTGCERCTEDVCLEGDC